MYAHIFLIAHASAFASQFPIIDQRKLEIHVGIIYYSCKTEKTALNAHSTFRDKPIFSFFEGRKNKQTSTASQRGPMESFWFIFQVILIIYGAIYVPFYNGEMHIFASKLSRRNMIHMLFDVPFDTLIMKRCPMFVRLFSEQYIYIVFIMTCLVGKLRKIFRREFVLENDDLYPYMSEYSMGRVMNKHDFLKFMFRARPYYSVEK